MPPAFISAGIGAAVDQTARAGKTGEIKIFLPDLHIAQHLAVVQHVLIAGDESGIISAPESFDFFQRFPENGRSITLPGLSTPDTHIFFSNLFC